MPGANWQKRVDSGDWDAITAELNDFGGALLPRLLTCDEADAIKRLYPDDGLFRATIDMRRYRFGEGEYRYFQQPYPEPIGALKQSLYPGCYPSRGTGGPSSAGSHRGRTPSTTGSTCVMRRARRSRPQYCSSMARATGTHYTEICTASWYFHCRSSST